MKNHVISDPTLLSLWERQEILDAINFIKYKILSCGDDVKRRSKYYFLFIVRTRDLIVKVEASGSSKEL